MPQTPSRGKKSLPLILIFMAAAAGMFIPTAVFLTIGLLPTGVVFLIDKDRSKRAMLTVGSMNLAGVIPFVIELWLMGQTLEHVFKILHHAMTWAIMYGTSVFGWLIYFSVTPVVEIFLNQRTKLRISDLELKQEALCELWGEDVKD